MSTTLYRDIPMGEAVAEALRGLENQSGQAQGPLLYGLASALRPRHLLVVGDHRGAVTLWLALAASDGGEFHVLDSEGKVLAEHHDLLRRAGLEEVLSPATERGDTLFDMAVLAGEPESYPSSWEWLRGNLAPEVALVAGDSEALRAMLTEEGDWRQVRIEAEPALLVAARTERPQKYPETPREAFVALLVGLRRPENLALGSNVVFDGTVKPRGTRVNFSGMGGQIGAGDLLIAYPDDLARFTPLPGAAALVLGELETAIHSTHVAVPLEDGTVTLVVA
jgi:predicted O-methyltransferase YrrM